MGTRLYVGNLAGSTHADTLHAAFSATGEVTGVDLVANPETGQPIGYAFVTIGLGTRGREGHCRDERAVLEGRSIRVNEAEERQRIDE